MVLLQLNVIGDYRIDLKIRLKYVTDIMEELSDLYPLFVVVVQTAIEVRRQLGGVHDFCEAL